MKYKKPPYDKKKYGGFFMYKYRKMAVMISLLAGFIGGILFINLTGDTYFNRNKEILSVIVEKSQNEVLKQSGYFYTLLKLRGGFYLLLGLLGELFAGGIWLTIAGVIFCFAEGMLSTSVFLHHRVIGIWLFILSQLPHMVFYIILYEQLMMAYLTDKGEAGKKQYLKKWAMYIPVMVAGIFLEYSLNPWFLKWIQKWI